MNAVVLPTLTIAPSVRVARRTAASKKTVAPRAVGDRKNIKIKLSRLAFTCVSR